MSESRGDEADVVVRPMRLDDVPAAVRCAHESLREAGARYGWPMPVLDDAHEARVARRHTHLLRHDPTGAWVAQADGAADADADAADADAADAAAADAAGSIVGVAFAIRRGPLWFLSLLVVAPGRQGRGLGARLLEAAHRTSAGSTIGMIIASADPKALRRYAGAGFDLRPAYGAHGPVDRALLPAVTGVREGDWAADGERVDALVERLRGARYGVDLEHLRKIGARLLMADDGFAILREGALAALGADRPATAQALLWAALAEAGPGDAELDPITADQQWALQVALAARLSLRPGESVCTRGAVGPLTPYLPTGTFG